MRKHGVYRGRLHTSIGFALAPSVWPGLAAQAHGPLMAHTEARPCPLLAPGPLAKGAHTAASFGRSQLVLADGRRHKTQYEHGSAHTGWRHRYPPVPGATTPPCSLRRRPACFRPGLFCPPRRRGSLSQSEKKKSLAPACASFGSIHPSTSALLSHPHFPHSFRSVLPPVSSFLPVRHDAALTSIPGISFASASRCCRCRPHPSLSLTTLPSSRTAAAAFFCSPQSANRREFSARASDVGPKLPTLLRLDGSGLAGDEKKPATNACARPILSHPPRDPKGAKQVTLIRKACSRDHDSLPRVGRALRFR